MQASRAALLAPWVAGLAVLLASPMAISAPPGSANTRVLSVTKNLPAGGTDVPFTFEANGDAIIFQIFVDNHPSDDAGLCVPEDQDTQVICNESDHRLVSMTIDGDDFRPGLLLPETLGGGDVLSIRPLFAPIFRMGDVAVPLSGGSEFVMIFDTENEENDVAIEVTVGFIGGQGATLN